MSSVVVQVGQCGNQIGEQFWRVVENASQSNNRHVYNSRDAFLRSVNLDSEPKAVRHMLNSSKCKFRRGNVLCGKRGRGSNWAMGYHGMGSHAEDRLVEQSIEAIRKETERCETFSGIILMHSLGGGTGSGLGSRLTENLRDEFQLQYLLSCAVAPHASGESPLQHYNSLLTLAALQRNCDAVILMHNDEILRRLERRARGMEKDKQFSLDEMNTHIVSCLAGLFLPTDSLTSSSGCSIGLEPWEMVRSLCAMPQNKFLHVNSVEKSKSSWDAMASHLSQAKDRYDENDKPFSSICNLVVARGDSSGRFPLSIPSLEAKIKSIYHCVTWNPFPVDVWTDKRSIHGVSGPASLTVGANCSSVTQYLQHVINRARDKYDVKAYLHWYWKYGCCQTDFEEAFETVAAIRDSYWEAVK